MDTRKTLDKNETFLVLLQSLFNSQDKASLLVDDNGIIRAEGLITAIYGDAETPYIELDNAMKITLKSIIAVNGTFLPDYSEC